MASYSNMKHSRIHVRTENDEDGEYAVIELRDLYPLRDVHPHGVELHLTFAFLRELVEKSVEVLPQDYASVENRLPVGIDWQAIREARPDRKARQDVLDDGRGEGCGE